MRALFCLALISVALSASVAPAQQVKPACTDNSRACMIQAATAYLDSLVAHDASKVPLAPAIRRTEQGRADASSETQIRELQKLEPDMAGRGETRFFVDEPNHMVIAYTLLRVPGTKADPNRKTFTDGVPADQRKPSTIHLAERFKVENGLITEIEAIYHTEAGTMDARSGWPE